MIINIVLIILNYVLKAWSPGYPKGHIDFWSVWLQGMIYVGMCILCIISRPSSKVIDAMVSFFNDGIDAQRIWRCVMPLGMENQVEINKTLKDEKLPIKSLLLPLWIVGTIVWCSQFKVCILNQLAELDMVMSHSTRYLLCLAYAEHKIIKGSFFKSTFPQEAVLSCDKVIYVFKLLYFSAFLQWR